MLILILIINPSLNPLTRHQDRRSYYYLYLCMFAFSNPLPSLNTAAAAASGSHDGRVLRSGRRTTTTLCLQGLSCPAPASDRCIRTRVGAGFELLGVGWRWAGGDRRLLDPQLGGEEAEGEDQCAPLQSPPDGPQLRQVGQSRPAGQSDRPSEGSEEESIGNQQRPLNPGRIELRDSPVRELRRRPRQRGPPDQSHHLLRRQAGPVRRPRGGVPRTEAQNRGGGDGLLGREGEERVSPESQGRRAGRCRRGLGAAGGGCQGGARQGFFGGCWVGRALGQEEEIAAVATRSDRY